MADNYLERRMEDLRSGRLTASSKTPASTLAQRKGYLSIPFPTRRVLVVGDIHGIGRAVALAFVKTGCKTALFDPDKAEGDRLAHDHGIRFHRVDLHDGQAISQAMTNLFQAWRGLDIVIIPPAAESILPVITDEWYARCKALPYPNDFPSRLIVISVSDNPDSFGQSGSPDHLCNLHTPHFPTTIVNGCDPGHVEAIARLCVFLASPGNDFISTISLRNTSRQS